MIILIIVLAQRWSWSEYEKGKV